MKIFQVLCGRTWGGGSVVVHAITRELIARGDEVWVFSFDQESDRRFLEIGARIARPPVWVENISPLDAVVFAYLWRLCRKEKFDLVATHTSKGGFLGRLAARWAGVPCIVHHAHGFSYNKELSPRARTFYVALERFAARSNDMIISVNEQHRKMAIELGVEKPWRIRTVHNGIDITPFFDADGAAVRRELGVDSTVTLVGAVGRLAPQKGMTYLLQAFRSLMDSHPSAHLVIGGDGPLRADLQREARELGLGSRVSFLGFRRDVPALLAALDIYVQPSLWEGHSISLIEALSAGKPIISTEIDGNLEAIDDGETGLLVPPANPQALASALTSLLASPALRRRLAACARSAAAERFTQSRMVAENLVVYDAVLNMRSIRTPPPPSRARSQRKQVEL